jgi:triosephosphate isomerase
VAVIKRINAEVQVLCGAGITRGEDATAAIKLGTRGVLVSSGVVKSPNPSHVLTELAEAIRT